MSFRAIISQFCPDLFANLWIRFILWPRKWALHQNSWSHSQSCEMSRIFPCKIYWQFWGKSSGEHAKFAKIKAFLGKICTMDERQLFYKSINFVSFVQFKCQSCRDLCVFPRVKFGLTVLLHVKNWHFATLAAPNLIFASCIFSSKLDFFYGKLSKTIQAQSSFNKQFNIVTFFGPKITSFVTIIDNHSGFNMTLPHFDMLFVQFREFRC